MCMKFLDLNVSLNICNKPAESFYNLLCFWQPFYFNSLLLNTDICILYSLHVQIRPRTLVLMHLMGELWVLFLFCIIAQCLPVHTGHSRWSKTQQHKKPENRRRGRRVSVSYVQRPCRPLPGSSHFLNLLPCFTNPTCRYFTSWEWHKRQSTISLVLLQTAHTKPTDSTFKFNRRKNGQQKCPPEGNVLLFYFEYTSEPALYHCSLSKNTAVVMK